jgi:hypothetical protein
MYAPQTRLATASQVISRPASATLELTRPMSSTLMTSRVGSVSLTFDRWTLAALITSQAVPASTWMPTQDESIPMTESERVKDSDTNAGRHYTSPSAVGRVNTNHAGAVQGVNAGVDAGEVSANEAVDGQVNIRDAEIAQYVIRGKFRAGHLPFWSHDRVLHFGDQHLRPDQQFLHGEITPLLRTVRQAAVQRPLRRL